MKPLILQKPMAKITEVHRTPCPACQADTLHSGPVCLVCGHVLDIKLVPPADRYYFPSPRMPASPDAWRFYFGTDFEGDDKSDDEVPEWLS